MQKNYKPTMYACFVGYVAQAIVNNFAPLLFLTFHNTYGISMEKITMLVSINFALQLTVDAISVGIIDRLGYRLSAVIAHALSALGLLALVILPEICADPFAGLLAAVVIYAIGGGLLEVLISPIVEACPTDNKEKAMSLLHSFYCWGHVGVVLLSTLFFSVFGIANWKILAAIWALIPIVNAFVFTRVPIAPLMEEGDKGLSLRELAKMKLFWVALLAMLCGGASEHSVSQWASVYAETALGVSKTLGDLLGPMLFATTMGLSRVFYGKFGEKIDLHKFMGVCCVSCIAAYLLLGLSPWPAVGLIGCGVAGFSVGIFWPGLFSMAAATMRRGGTALFCLLALAGDLGCSVGPGLVGLVSSAAGDDLKMGLLAAILFPAVLIGCVVANKKLVAKEK